MRKLGEYFDLTALITSATCILIAIGIGGLILEPTGAPAVLVLAAALMAGLFGGMALTRYIKDR